MNYSEFLVSVEIAEALKKIGFDKNNDKVVKLYDYENKKIIEPTWEFHYRQSYFGRYLDFPDEYCPLFTYEQVFAWFREKGLVGIIETNEILNEGEPLYYASVDDTRDGKDYHTDLSPILSFTEYNLIDGGFSQERPIDYGEYIGKWGKFWNDKKEYIVSKLERYSSEGFRTTTSIALYKFFEPLTEEQIKILNLE